MPHAFTRFDRYGGKVDALMKDYRVKPGVHVHLRDHDAQNTGDYKSEDDAADHTEHLRLRLDALQERLYAGGRRAVLVVLQGIDTDGKDGTIRHVMSGVNPQGCIVTSFKAFTPLEKAHDFLWRVHAACPSRGYIGNFNRSHYEDVLITRVHGWITNKDAHRDLKHIGEFEKMLTADCLVQALEDVDPRPPTIRGVNWKKLGRKLSST